jgi:hypothetical protein
MGKDGVVVARYTAAFIALSLLPVNIQTSTMETQTHHVNIGK